ncbi:FAD:protein FMN transferase [Aquisalimonas lutea]|uniref:FAD:protein FMN transferase n=1 Tax=Aquisalimonas lutea TaxID=1327750 RepID=UPI0025B38BE9|nr:FAD:protein FMN transferase [Aquisalimonas lutea]MDN3516106.1 FAD:protein FMN transferase [Aquisalimonas lutea]
MTPGQRIRRAGRRLLALGLAAAVLAACSGEPDVHHRRMLVFGTMVDISLYGLPDDRAEPLLAEMEAHLRQRHDAWHAWEDSALTRFNEQLRKEGRARIHGPLRPLFDQGLPLARRTGYRFDPGIGALARAWGFHGDLSGEAQPPSDAFLRDWRAHPHSAADLERDGDMVTTDTRDMRLDFGAVAKGIALAEVHEQLAATEVDAGIVNAGGDLVTIRQPGQRRWRIGIRHPEAEGVVGTLSVDADEAVFTSGDYERRFEHEGNRYHHILDPDTGRPARGLRAVTVIHEDPALADAAATALMVAGPDDWRRVAAELELDHVLVITPQQRVRATPAMARRLDPDREADMTFETVELP